MLKDTTELARRFNNYAIERGSILRLRVLEDTRIPSFQMHYELNQDPFVNIKVYEEGTGVIYPSSMVEEVLDTFAKNLGFSGISYNTTRTIGWLQI